MAFFVLQTPNIYFLRIPIYKVSQKTLLFPLIFIKILKNKVLSFINRHGKRSRGRGNRSRGHENRSRGRGFCSRGHENGSLGRGNKILGHENLCLGKGNKILGHENHFRGSGNKIHGRGNGNFVFFEKIKIAFYKSILRFNFI
jgi:hypothetical protein